MITYALCFATFCNHRIKTMFWGLIMLYCSAALQALMRSPSLTVLTDFWANGPVMDHLPQKLIIKLFTLFYIV